MRSDKIFLIMTLITVILIPLTCCDKTPYPPPDDGAWSKSEVFTNPEKTIEVNHGDKFIIGFDIRKNLFAVIEEKYDASFVDLLERKTIEVREQNDQMPVYYWLLFQAKETGETQITVEHRQHLVYTLVDAKTFHIKIE